MQFCVLCACVVILRAIPNHRDTEDIARHSRNQRFHPDRMKVNSRGRAALREAHGKIRRRIDPVRVKLVSLFDPFRVGSPLPLQPWASRKAARPRLLNLVLSGPEFLLKKQEVNRLFHRLRRFSLSWAKTPLLLKRNLRNLWMTLLVLTESLLRMLLTRRRPLCNNAPSNKHIGR